MKGIRNLRVMGISGALAVATFLTAGFAGARPRQCVGDFTLTSETRWGTAILPAGHYTFELDEAADLITVRGQNRAVIFVSRHDEDNRVDSNALILASRDGKHVVRALRLAQGKKVFFYAVPKETPKAVAQDPVMIERVPVTISGN
jgi:hypothetical protein